MDKKPIISKGTLGFLLVLLGVLLIVPFFTSNYIIGVGITIFFFAYFGSCWNLIGGYGGQFHGAIAPLLPSAPIPHC